MVDTRSLFTGIAERYEQPAELLSFGQYARWRRCFARASAALPSDLILDVAAGTGLTARALLRTTGARVIGVDLTPAMLARARSRLGSEASLAAADARALPFRDATFDVVAFSYLLRYVDDVPAALTALTQVLKPGGMLVSMEFGVPRARWAKALWRLYTSVVMPVAAKPFGSGWARVGAFLGPSISAWGESWPIERQRAAWRDAGVEPALVRELSFGAGVVIAGRKR